MLTYGRKFYNPDFCKKSKNMIAEMMQEPSLEEFIFPLQKVEEIIDEFIIETDYLKQKELVFEMEQILKRFFSNLMDNIPKALGIEAVTDGGEKRQNNQAIRNSKKFNKQLKEKSSNFKKSINKPQKIIIQDSEDGKQESKSIQNRNNSATDELKQSAESIIKDIDEKIEEQTQKDIVEIQKMKNAGSQAMDISTSPYIIKSEDKLMSIRLTNIIKRLKQDLRPHYVKRLKSGNIDIRKIMQQENKEIIDMNVFKKYKHSKIDRTKMAVAIILDSSGSMGYREWTLALRAGYCVADCLERTGSKTTVISFDVNFKVLKKFSEPIHKMLLDRASGGGTSPEPAMLFSEKELEKMKREYGINHLLMLMISDCHFEHNSLHNLDIFATDKSSMGRILDRFKKKFKVIFFNIYNPALTHPFEKILREKSHFFYKIKDFDELYHKMMDFIKKYELHLHRDVARGF